MKFNRVRASVSATLLMIVSISLTGCLEFSGTGPALPDCANIVGTWHSPEYSALQVKSDNTHNILPGISMSLTINHQDGCTVSGSHTWTNGVIGGTEYIAGAISKSTSDIVLVEAGPHPEEGTTGRMLGRLVGNELTLEYSGMAQAGGQANVFSLVLTRDDDLAERQTCEDITGTWSSSEYRALQVNSDGSHNTIDNLEMTLTIAFQEGCIFRGHHDWSNGELGGREVVAGLIHSYDNELTFLELDPHPEGGASARIAGRLEGDHLHWNYIGRSSDGSRGISFGVNLHRDGTPAPRARCLAMTGTWGSAEPHTVITANEDGSIRTHKTAHTAIEVVEQIGCKFKGFNHWTNSEGEIISEVIVGVIDGEAGVLNMLEVGTTPPEGSTGVFVDRIVSTNRLEQLYTGHAGNLSYVQVYQVELMKE